MIFQHTLAYRLKQEPNLEFVRFSCKRPVSEGGTGGMPVPLFHSPVDKCAVQESAAIPEKFQTPLGIPILFAAVGVNVLTHPQQLAAPSESTSGPHRCQSTPWPLCWELMFQTLYSVAGVSVQEISVQCQPAGTGLPNLREDSLMFVTDKDKMFVSEEMIS